MPGQPRRQPPADSGPAMPLKEVPEPLAAADSSGIVKCIVLCTLYIAISAVLIQFNKHLMHQDRFPFAMALTTCHMTMTLVCSYLLYIVKPSLYTSMSKTHGQTFQLLRWFIPLGCLFALGLGCSNKAYLYCNVAFLQFMKESNVAVVFALSSIVGLQVCTRSRLFTMAWIMLGCCMAIHGEVDFVWIGFIIQVISQLGECGKTVLGEWIMRDMKLDPLTYTMFMSPICLSIVSTMTVLTWDHEIYLRLLHWWPLLLPNACLAFLLNVTVAVIIKECNAMTFMLSGLVKDIVIVLASMLLFGEIVVRQQLIGFVICLAGIGFWSLMRIDPTGPLVSHLQIALGEVEKMEKSELTKLLAKPRQSV